MVAEFLRVGWAALAAERVQADGKVIDVRRYSITEAGRRATEDHCNGLLRPSPLSRPAHLPSRPPPLCHWAGLPGAAESGCWLLAASGLLRAVIAPARRCWDYLSLCVQRREAKWCNGRHPLPWQTSFARQTDRAVPAQSTLFLARGLESRHTNAA